MTTIHKFILPPEKTIHRRELPNDSQILTVQFQGNHLCVWYTRPMKPAGHHEYEIRVIGTGWEIQEPEIGIYVNTVQKDGFVWHVFARKLN